MGKPAARMGDSTAHGGVITVGCPTVLIGGQPAARIGDMHMCPMLNPGTPPPPHVGGAISLGSPMVLIGGMPAARMGDMAICMGPPDTILGGCPTVLIGEGPGSGGGAGGGAGQAGSVAAAAAIVGNPGPQAQGPHWVDIQLKDSADMPVTGMNYQFTHVAGQKEVGILTGDGRVRRGSLPESGTCALRILMLANAKWSSPRINLNDPITMSVDAEGFDEGADATLTVMARGVQGADHQVDLIHVNVQGEKIKHNWKFAFPKDSSIPIHSYYFIAKIGHQVARSQHLTVVEDLQLDVKDGKGKAVPNVEFFITSVDGIRLNGKSDSSGHAVMKSVPLRHWSIVLPNNSGKAKKYDEQFLLKDGNGRPLANIFYTAKLSNGNFVHGQTDSDGHTERIYTDAEHKIEIHFGHVEDF